MLDGFPRTEAQAKELGGIMTRLDRDIDAVIYLDVPAETLKERLSDESFVVTVAQHTTKFEQTKSRRRMRCFGSHDFYQRRR